jgi:hypothetical protein
MTMTNPTTPARFEDRLLHALRHVVAQRPAPQAVPSRRVISTSRRRVALSGAALATVLAVTAILATGGGVSPSSAYAVQPRSDGTVSVTVNDLRDAAGLQQKLRAAGIPAVVKYVDDAPACTTALVPPPGVVVHSESGTDPGPSLHSAGGGSLPPPAGGTAQGQGTGQMRVDVRHDANGDTSATFALRPGDYKAGDKLVITAAGGQVSSLSIAVTSSSDSAPQPPCIPAG